MIKNNNRMLRLLWNYSPGYVIITFVVNILEGIPDIINILIVKWIIDLLFTNSPFETICIYTVASIGALILIAIIRAWYYDRFKPLKINGFSSMSKEKLYRKTIQCDLAYQESSEYYDKYIRAGSEIVSRPLAVLDSLSVFTKVIFQISAIITLIISLNGVLLAFSFAGLCIPIVILLLKNKVEYKFQYETTKHKKEISYYDRLFYEERYQKENKVYKIAPLMIGKMQSTYQRLYAMTKKRSRAFILFNSLQNAIHLLIVGGMILYLSFSIINGQISIGSFAALLTAAQQLIGMLSSLFEIIPKIQNNAMYAGNYIEFMEYKPKINCIHSGSVNLFKSGDICFSNVSFSYSEKNDAVKNITLNIPQGSAVAIIGDNGAGKSTLVKLLLRLYECSGGSITIGGTDIRNFDCDSVYEKMLVIFQDYNIYSATVAENIVPKDKYFPEEKEKMMSALFQVGLGDRVEKMPNKIDTYLNKEIEDGEVLSGGERQKLVLSRMLLNNYDVLILDEPTSALDIQSEENIFELIKSRSGGKTVIFITHNYASVSIADHIVLMKDGEIAESGSHAELMEKGGIYAKNYMIQKRRFEEREKQVFVNG